jgi:Holliday junction DNA helicase RuvA
MIDYIKGEITELNPTYAVVETAGVGYFINITLPVYTTLRQLSSARLYVYESIREDAHILYGFLQPIERQLFLLLISVNGIGPNTARMIMSSYSVAELQHLISTENTAGLNAIKGIGTKTAQRMILDLRDKILKIQVDSSGEALQPAVTGGANREEAVSALVMLGFAANVSQKAVDAILKVQPVMKVELLIKTALQNIR